MFMKNNLNNNLLKYVEITDFATGEVSRLQINNDIILSFFKKKSYQQALDEIYSLQPEYAWTAWAMDAFVGEEFKSKDFMMIVKEE